MKILSKRLQAPLLWRVLGSKTLTFLLLVMVVQFANGQKNIWSLQDCIDAGLENNIGIKIQKLEVKRTQKSRVSMVNELLPIVSLFGSQSYNFGSTIDPSTNGRVSSNIQYDNFYFNAQMNLLDFGAIVASEKSKIGIEFAKAEQEIIENEYKLQILESFYQTLFTQELVEIQKQQLVNTHFNLSRITKEVEIGSKPKSDLYDIQFAFAQEEKLLMETQQLFESQKLQLFQLMNVEDVSWNTVKLENKVGTITVTSDILSNPKIKGAALSLESSTKQVRFQRAKNLPVLSSFYQLSSFYYKPLNNSASSVDNFGDQIGNNKTQQLGLQLAIPIFNGFKNNKTIISAQIETQKSKLKLEQEQLKVEQQLKVEYMNQANYIVVEHKLIEVLEYAKASFSTTQSKFTSGITDAFLFSIAKNNLLKSEYDLLKNQLQNQYTSNKINLIRSNRL